MTKIITDPKITVELILNLIEHDQTIPQIMNDYDLTEDAVRAAIRYAKKGIKEKFPAQTAVAHEIYFRREHR